MEDKSKQVQEKVLSLVPSGHEPVTVKVDLIFLEKNPFYKIELYSRADKIDFMPKWVNIHVSWEFNVFRFMNCFLSPVEVESLLSCIRIEPIK